MHFNKLQQQYNNSNNNNNTTIATRTTAQTICSATASICKRRKYLILVSLCPSAKASKKKTISGSGAFVSQSIQWKVFTHTQTHTHTHIPKQNEEKEENRGERMKSEFVSFHLPVSMASFSSFPFLQFVQRPFANFLKNTYPKKKREKRFFSRLEEALIKHDMQIKIILINMPSLGQILYRAESNDGQKF